MASENQRAQEAALALYRREYREGLVEEGAMWAEHQVGSECQGGLGWAAPRVAAAAG